ncbi:hypothetical protein T492DRAFT_512443 [Pavlovales sp. CCMP2436]|nr:hypothetical protein T492DRAFT_512443 [Pavlovales sp. CCMP2436]
MIPSAQQSQTLEICQFYNSLLAYKPSDGSNTSDAPCAGMHNMLPTRKGKTNSMMISVRVFLDQQRTMPEPSSIQNCNNRECVCSETQLHAKSPPNRRILQPSQQTIHATSCAPSPQNPPPEENGKTLNSGMIYAQASAAD